MADVVAGLSEGLMAERRRGLVAPPVVELLGPPGVGKTEVRRALSADGERILPLSIYWRPARTPTFLRSAVSLAPILLPHRRRPGRVRGWIVRLESSAALLERAATRGVGGVVLDQGPVYTMVRLCEAVPEGSRDHGFARWWRRTVERWSRRLSLLVVLDAPDEVLLRRIGGRRKPHRLKGEDRERARAHLARERSLYERVIGELTDRRPIPILRFDTARHRPAVIAAETIAALGAG